MKGLLISRDYEAQFDCHRATVTVTLGCDLGSDGRSIGGEIFVAGMGAPSSPISWTFDGQALVAELTAPVSVELKAAITAFLIHFVRTLEDEIDQLGGGSTVLH